MQYITFRENDLNIVFSISDNHKLSLLHFSVLPFELRDFDGFNFEKFVPVEISVLNENSMNFSSESKMSRYSSGPKLCYRYHTDTRNPEGRKLEFVMFDDEDSLEVTLHYQFYNGISIVRCWTEVYNTGSQVQLINYVSSFLLYNFDKESEDNTQLYLFYNDFGNDLIGEERRLNRPGFINRDSGELATTFIKCLKGGEASGYSNCQHRLAPEEVYSSVPVTVVAAKAGRDSASALFNSFKCRLNN